MALHYSAWLTIVAMIGMVSSAAEAANPTPRTGTTTGGSPSGQHNTSTSGNPTLPAGGNKPGVVVIKAPEKRAPTWTYMPDQNGGFLVVPNNGVNGYTGPLNATLHADTKQEARKVVNALNKGTGETDPGKGVKGNKPKGGRNQADPSDGVDGSDSSAGDGSANGGK